MHWHSKGNPAAEIHLQFLTVFLDFCTMLTKRLHRGGVNSISVCVIPAPICSNRIYSVVTLSCHARAPRTNQKVFVQAVSHQRKISVSHWIQVTHLAF
jgi:hypothetical protein